jgi:hypothetical protein
MWTIIDLQAPGRALSCSFAALSLTRMGMVMKDEGLIRRARGQYGYALTALQSALYDPELAFEDRTLAAIRTMSIYEILSPTFSSTPAAKTHEEGMTQWCRAAGPRRIKTDFAMQVFLDVRWAILIHCIQRRRSSILAQAEWLDLPFQGRHKDSLQSLFDIGFEVATVLERLGVDGESDGDPIRLCGKTLDGLDAWYKMYWGWPEWEFLDLDPELDDCSSGELGNGFGLPGFTSIWHASNMVYYWWFKLCLCEELVASMAPVNFQGENATDSAHDSAHDSPLSNNAHVDSPSTASCPMLQNPQELSANCIMWAINIVLAAPCFLAEDTGWLGPQRYIFPLRSAMIYLGKAQSPFFSKAQFALKSLTDRLRPA